MKKFQLEKVDRGEGEQPSRNMCSSLTAQRLRHQGCHCHQSYHGVSEGRIGVSYGETFGLGSAFRENGSECDAASLISVHVRDFQGHCEPYLASFFPPLHIMRISYFNTEASSRPTMTHK